MDVDHWRKTREHLESALWELESARFKMIGQGDLLDKYSYVIKHMVETLVADMIDHIKGLEDER